MRECEERICITLPGQISLYAEDSNKAYGFTRWDGSCQGTNRACSLSTPRTGTVTYSVTASFGDNAPPSVALTAPGGGFVRGAVTVSADAADNFGVAKVDLALGGATVAATGARSPPPSIPPSSRTGRRARRRAPPTSTASPPPSRAPR